jgi:RHS repeat-associated protein
MPPTLQVSWSQIAGPSAVVFADPSQKSTTVTLGAPGVYVLRITVSDGEFAASDDLRIDLHAEANDPPVVNAGPDRTVTLPAHTITINGSVTDDGRPSGTLTISWTQVSPPLSQATVTFSSPHTAVTDATFPVAGVYVLRLTGSDGDFTVTSHVTVNVSQPTPNQPPSVDAGPNRALTLPTNSTTLTGTVLDDGLPVGGALTFKWTAVDPPGVVTFGTPTALSTTVTFGDPGLYTLRLTASDGELKGSDIVQVSVSTGPQTGPPPVAALTAPADGARLTGPTLVAGTAQSGTLLSWKLEYRLDGETTYTRFATGSTSVVDSTLGTLDPTMLLNGIYEIRLTATDTSGRLQRASQKVVVRDKQKIGPFSLSFVDLDIPVAGLPMRATRTYDSRDKGKGDFGAGWRLDLSNVRLQEKEIAGLSWKGVVVPGFFPSYCLQPTSSQVVTVTMTNGQVLEFEPVLTPACQQFVPIDGATVSFRPRPGTNASLAPAGDGFVFVIGSWPGDMELYDGNTYDIFDPSDYILTLPDGRQLSINQTRGLTQVKDLNGNTLTVSATGINHSSGIGMTFTRDAQGRITRITDPNGNFMTYGYDTNGDLVSFTDREENTTHFTYFEDQPHLLDTITDPRGITPVRNEYYEDGRIKSHTDAFGKTIQYAHDVTGRQEVVTDRNGATRVLHYDERGNVIKEVDRAGRVVDRTFNARNNRKSETVPHDSATTNPPTTLYTYEGEGTAAETDNVASVTDPDHNTTAYTYNARGQLTTIRDARGNFTVDDYDGSGNVIQAEVRATADGPALSRTAFTYFADGNIRTQRVWTDIAANTFGETAYEYFPNGRLKKETDSTGHATEYTYDGIGNQRTQKTTRTLPSGLTETLTTEYVYDGMGRLIKTIDPDTSYTETVYDALGHPKDTFDKRQKKTSRTYDEMGRLMRTDYPDQTFEETTYWPEGQRKTFKDRRGTDTSITSYAYDANGRLATTTYPGGAVTENFYDPAGRLEKTRDARGNVTTHEYFDNGRRKATNTQVGGTISAPVFARTSYTYDGNGNIETMTVPSGKTTTYHYDAFNRRILITFSPAEPGAPITTVQTAYDAAGRRVSETDQAGKTTRFAYDGLDRLTSVTQRQGPTDLVTSYEYDDLGNRRLQRDANTHETRFEYDRIGREIARILPDGKREEKTYDDVGNLTRKLDFAGRETLYGYDEVNRLRSRTYTGAPSENVSFTYTKTGRLETVTDRFGTTTHAYDLRDRPASLVYPGGSRLTMSYDGNGNRETLTAYPVSGPAIPAAFRYDAANRLDQVTDARSQTYGLGYDLNGNRATLSQPNGVSTTYVYNALNRLTNLTTAGAGLTVQSYGLTLGPAGNRTKITLGGGIERNYAYDDLYRLTQEKWTDTGAAFRQDDFTYDNVGNRLTRTLATSSGTTATSYTYDDRDRLRTENVTTYSYDDNGNLTTKDGDATYSWDRENRLARVTKVDGTTVEYAYDAFGNRLQTKTTPAGSTTPVVVNYVVDTSAGLSHVVADVDAGGALTSYYLRADGDLVAILRPNGTGGYVAKYPHADYIGSIRALTNEAGQVTDTYDYSAFGELLIHNGSDPQPYTFAGEGSDLISGFQYHRSRWMDPKVGRFIGMDRYPGDGADPVSLHKYLYAAASPVNRVDPSGFISMFPRPFLAWVGVKAHTLLSLIYAAIGGTIDIRISDDNKNRPDIRFEQYAVLLGTTTAVPTSLGEVYEIKSANSREKASPEARQYVAQLLLARADIDWHVGAVLGFPQEWPAILVAPNGFEAFFIGKTLRAEFEGEGAIIYTIESDENELKLELLVATFVILSLITMANASRGAELQLDFGLSAITSGL